MICLHATEKRLLHLEGEGLKQSRSRTRPDSTWGTSCCTRAGMPEPPVKFQLAMLYTIIQTCLDFFSFDSCLCCILYILLTILSSCNNTCGITSNLQLIKHDWTLFFCVNETELFGWLSLYFGHSVKEMKTVFACQTMKHNTQCIHAFDTVITGCCLDSMYVWSLALALLKSAVSTFNQSLIDFGCIFF